MSFSDLLKDNILVLDGAMGTMLQRAGLSAGENPALLSLTAPETVEGIHAAYLDAGSRVVFANTFSAAAPKLEGSGVSVEQAVSAAVRLAKRAAAPRGGFAALDIGPIGELVEPLGPLAFEDAVSIFARQIRAGAQAGADLIAIETMMDLYETKAALLAAKENCDLPVFVAMTFEANGRTFTGCDVPAMAVTLEGLGADAIGFNCSVGPRQLVPLVQELRRWTSLPIIAKPNAGLPNAAGSYDLSPEEFASGMAELVGAGASIVGGCCGTDPVFIRALAGTCGTLSPPPVPAGGPPCAVSSATGALILDRPRVIGERLNPTGKKLLKQALADGDMGYLMRQAAAQSADRAEILDINVGMPGIDEPAMMARAVRAVQSVVQLPLQIDSPNAGAIEAGLRAANGRALMNSVNGKDAVLDELLPIAKKYGAVVVGLTLDEDGIPETVEGRLRIAEKIVRRAAHYGIPARDVAIDCLTLTAGAGEENARITLDAVRRVTEELGLRTILGVSNVSFGLPRRDIVNRTFLTMALQSGLSLAILNPGDAGMMEAFDAHRLLSGRDPAGAAFIERYSGSAAPAPEAKAPLPAPECAAADGEKGGGDNILTAIKSGLEGQAASLTKELLSSADPESIINKTLIPILDGIGKEYETGLIFLPQLIRAAQAAKAAFDVIRETLAKSKTEQADRGCVVLATVRGDVHDIGKNIVRAVLENYGYRMIDLGRDVPPKTVVEAVKSSGAKLAGLSALMTTTLPAMAETIQLLHAECPDCKVCVGGAVLTEPYARSIGADYYAPDASATVAAARDVYGQ